MSIKGQDFSSKISDLSEQEQKLNIEKELLLNKALASDDVDQILKARRYMSSQSKNIEKREDSNLKAILVDPYDLNGSLGFKNKSFSVSYDVLRAMARTHIIKSIIETRKDQVSVFCQPQANKYSTGFVIKKKSSFFLQKQQDSLTKEEEKKIEKITEFLLSCGSNSNFWHADSFDTFIKKIVGDSLTFDQATFEIGRNRANEPIEFLATDASTMRIADSYESEDTFYKNGKSPVLIKGYAPSYVQVINSVVENEYYPWELCFGTRNASTDIKSNGYGRSELEDMIQTVTALLNSDNYNANFFKVGSAPKGILKYTGDMNLNTVEQFKNQWIAQTAGVMNMHKIPIMNADKMDFINLQQSNKDMEYSKYQEFLIKISCALYKIDPSEIGFPMSGSSDAKPMFEGNNEARLKHSKDKGLNPLLRQIERWINKYIIYQIDNNYEFRFVGIDGETTFSEELENAIKMVNNFKTLNEIRKEFNMQPLPGGDIVLNPMYFQSMMSQQQSQESDSNPFDEMFGTSIEEENKNPFMDEKEDTDNPFMKGMKEDIARILSSETN